MDALNALSQAVEKAGSQTAFARQHGISLAYVNDVLQGRREPGDKILRALGMERSVTYRKKPRTQSGGNGNG